MKWHDNKIGRRWAGHVTEKVESRVITFEKRDMEDIVDAHGVGQVKTERAFTNLLENAEGT